MRERATSATRTRRPSCSKGAPKAFARSDLDTPVTREFCASCGTHLVSKAPAMPGINIVKVGTLDEADWNITEAARRLDIARSYLYKLITLHGLRR